MAARSRTHQSLETSRKPSNLRPRLSHVTSRDCSARESASCTYFRHTADQSPLRRRIYCCLPRDLFFSFLNALFFLLPPLFSFPFLFVAPIALLPVSLRAKKKKRKNICPWINGDVVRSANRFRGVEPIASYDALFLTN